MKPDVRSKPSGPASSKRIRYVVAQADRPSSRRPVASLAFTRLAPSRRVPSPGGEPVEGLEGDQPGRIVRRGLTLEPDQAGALGIEDDDRRGQDFVLVGSVGSRVVELVEHVRVDAPRAPLAVDR